MVVRWRGLDERWATDALRSWKESNQIRATALERMKWRTPSAPSGYQLLSAAIW